MAGPIRFYLDENVPVAIAIQLQRRGIDAITVRDLDLLGDSDRNHLSRATRLDYVFCTNDADFVALATSGMTHSGIVFGQQHKHGVGTWVRFLELLASVADADEMRNRIEFVS